MVLTAILAGLVAGILVGFLGIGGGVVLVPMLTSLLGFNQHVAQGTSLFMQLPPLGLGALLVYWRRGQVDLRAGAVCALGFFLAGYFGSRIAIAMDGRELQGFFGVFVMVAAVLLWRKPDRPEAAPGAKRA
jgi:uncharacterized protein